MKAIRLSLIAFASFGILVGNLFAMQVLHGEHFQALSERNRVRTVYLEAPRGEIRDRRGQILATSRLSFNCAVMPYEKRAHLKQGFELVASILGQSPEDLEKRYWKKKAGAFNSVLLAEDISSEQAVAIEESLEVLPGFTIETRPQREYRHAGSVAHLVGYLGPMSEEEKQVLEPYGYRVSDWMGREGLERVYEDFLRGRPGGLQIEVNNRSRLVRALGVKEPKEGKDLELTIDVKLQSHVQKLLESQKGAVIVMDLKDGGLLSVNSAPSFDPNLFSSALGRRSVGAYLKDADTPLLNRAVQGQYPPGSIFKIITALAALDRGKISAKSSFNCHGAVPIAGTVFHCWQDAGHGPQRLEEAFAHSCNVYFYTTGLLAGPDKLFQESLEFGFHALTGIDLPGEKKGFVPSREWKKRRKHEAWYSGDTANLSIGQGNLQVTPLQALVMVSTVATRGLVLTPHVVSKIDGQKISVARARTLRVSPQHWDTVTEGLDAVVNEPTGTGRLAKQADFRVAGKTGTAQSGQDKTHAWFVGFAPLENPKVAMVVFLEHGGRGGVSAARIASDIFKWLKGASYL